MPVMIQPSKRVYLSSLDPGSVLEVETKHHRYRIECLRRDEVQISGHPTICPTPIVARLLGSLCNGGPVEPGLVGSGMRLVFRVDEHVTVTTSEITRFQVHQPVSDLESEPVR